MKERNKKQENIIFTEEEEKILKKYIEEYNDTYPKILLLNPFEFFQNIIKGLELSLKEKINGFSSTAKSKIEDYLIEKIYPTDFKFALFVKKNISNRSKEEISSHYFKGEILSHCDEDKCNGYYVHSCGEKFQYFRYKKTKNIFDINSTNNNSPDKKQSQYDICLYCEKCEMIYKSNFIKFKCSLTGEDFYSKIINNNDNNDNDDSNSNYPQSLATWKNYHCNAVINDKMKCQTCNSKLYFISPTKVLCKTCNKELNPLDIKYKCIVCKKNFSSQAKIFNPLEYKALKICIKEAIISKIKAKPTNLGCGCDADINKIKFIHRKTCRGELFLGELNSKKVIICNKCDSLGLYNNYIWTCPICYKKFRETTEKTGEDKEINSPEKEKKEKKIVHNKKSSDYLNTDIKSVLFNKIFKKEKLNINDNNKENVDINNNDNMKYKLNKNERIILRKKHRSIADKDPSNSIQSIQSRLFTEIDNKNIIKLLEEDENNNFTNKKAKLMLNSKLINFTPGIVNKYDSKIINKIPKGNPKNIKGENIEAKNLDVLFEQSTDKNIVTENKSPCKKNRNKSDLQSRNDIKMHKAISTQDIIRNKKINNCIKEECLEERINEKLNKINNELNKRAKPSKTPSSRDIPSKNDNSVNKLNNEPIKRVMTKIKYNSSAINECGESELIRIIRNIRQHQENKKSRKKSAKSGMASIDNEHIKIKRKLNRHNKSKEITKNIFEKEINKIEMLKDFNVTDYKIIKQIGQGSFGQIFMVEDNNNQKYALKKIIASSDREIKGLKQEYQILFDIQSNLNKNENNDQKEISIVNIYGLSTKQLDPTTYVMYVLMELGDIDWEKEIIKRQKLKEYYTEEELMNILLVLVSTLEKLQKENISHRDIKPQNILVFNTNNNKKGCYKLADFGEAKELLSGNKPTEKQTLRGTELYMSPILFYGLRSRKIKKYIKHNPYKSDVFSLGLCVLFAATLCFESLYDVRELKNNVSVKIIIEKYLKKRYSYKMIGIISNMLDINETTRDDFIELKKRIENM